MLGFGTTVARIDTPVYVNMVTVARHKAAAAVIGNVAVDDVQFGKGKRANANHELKNDHRL